MNASSEDRHEIATAMHWSFQITSIALEIILPVVVGRWLDQLWGTTCMTVIGALVGPPLGFWHLLILTGVVGGKPTKTDSDRDQRQ